MSKKIFTLNMEHYDLTLLVVFIVVVVFLWGIFAKLCEITKLLTQLIS